MVQKLLIVMAFGAFMISCTSDQEKMKTQLDSLKAELQTSQQFANTLKEVGTLMDSIDANRQLLRVNMVEGTTYADYTSRMKDINNYVKDTQTKIEGLEKTLRKSKSNANGYLATIKLLKADIEERNKEIASLKEYAESLKNKNNDLITTVGIQDAELTDKESQIQAKTQELAAIEAKIQDMLIKGKMNDADSYFARAQAVEETAIRTKLAPKKKKDTYRQAIELYKKSLSLGNDKAQAKIDELSKKVD